MTSRSGPTWRTLSRRSHPPQQPPLPSPTLHRPPLPPSSRCESIAWRHPPIHATPWLGSLVSASVPSGNPQPFDRSFSHPEIRSLDRSIARSPDGGGGGDPPGELHQKCRGHAPMRNCDRVLSTLTRELYEKAGLALYPSLIPTWRVAQARRKGGPAALPTVMEWNGPKQLSQSSSAWSPPGSAREGWRPATAEPSTSQKHRKFEHSAAKEIVRFSRQGEAT
jgi:hypothetical protein